METYIVLGFVTLCHILLLVCLIPTNAQKSEDKNEIPEMDQTNLRKFRSIRVQQIWDKANRMNLPPLIMTDLYADLKHHDEMLMEHKKLKSEGRDDDGMKEAELTKELHKTMLKYGIGAKQRIGDNVQNREKYAGSMGSFEDPRLDNLWRMAKIQGKFTPEELQRLEVEFMHHKRKVEEYEMLRSRKGEADDLSDNSVEKQLRMEEDQKKRQEMREMYEDIQEGYERLQLKTKKGILDDMVPFTEPRVARLWNEAKKGNFTKEELESIKEELKHFQVRIEKHEFFRDQLKNSAAKIDFHKDKEKLTTDKMTRFEHLQNKVQEMGAKVKRLHHDLSSRLSSIKRDKEL